MLLSHYTFKVVFSQYHCNQLYERDTEYWLLPESTASSPSSKICVRYVPLICSELPSACIYAPSKEAFTYGVDFPVSMSILNKSIKVSVTFGVSATVNVAVFPTSTFKAFLNDWK